jgi:glycosyltransferase involved in cell wall biosynthesis
VIRVSTIVPVLNGASTVAVALDSALSQRLDGQEVIVINDGSTDTTSSVLANYRSRIRLIEQPRRGLSAARNAGAALAKGEYLAFLDADDVWLEGRLAKTTAALEQNTNASLAFSDLIPMNQQGERLPAWVIGGPPTLADLQTHRCGIYPSAVTIRRSVFDLCGGFDETLPKLADHYLCMRAREHGEFAYVREALAIYRTTEFPLLADKYLSGFNPFVRAVRNRYGKRVRPLVAEFTMVFASSLIAKALLQLNDGARIAALRSFGRAVTVSPSFVLGLVVKRRVLTMRNIRRVLGTSASPRRVTDESKTSHGRR